MELWRRLCGLNRSAPGRPADRARRRRTRRHAEGSAIRPPLRLRKIGPVVRSPMYVTDAQAVEGEQGHERS
jgi:hypothetical protein